MFDRVLVLVIGVTATLVLLWLILCHRVWRTWFVPAHANVVRGPRRYADIPIPGTRVVTADGAGITCWFFAGQKPVTLVVCGGYRCFPEETMPLVADLNAAGFNVVLMAWRGCGRSDSTQVTFGEKEPYDLRAAITEARSRFPGTRVGIVGLSFGASMAIFCAAAGEPVDALWVDGPFRDPISVMHDAVHRRLRIWGGIAVWPVATMLWLRHGLHVWRVRTDLAARLIPDIPKKVLMYRDDGLLPVWRSRELSRAAGWEGQVEWMNGAGHASAHDRNRDWYVRECVAFFDSVLAGGGSTGGHHPYLTPVDQSKGMDDDDYRDRHITPGILRDLA